MSARINEAGKPVENLSIGKIIEVDGSHIVAELNPGLRELSRVYGGDIYPIGQFGSIVRVHFGRRIIYGMVGRLRMKAEYDAERGVVPQAAADERVVEADLFGEGQWVMGKDQEYLEFERGVATYPLPQQTVYLTPKSELRYIFGRGDEATIQLGQHVGSGGTPCYADLNQLLSKHTAILGSTGSGKSCAVAAVIHSILDKGKDYHEWNPRIIILDPHNEYHKSFPEADRLSTDEGSLVLPYWLLDVEETIGLLIGKTQQVATSQANVVKNALLSVRMKAATETLKLTDRRLTVDSPIPYTLGDPAGLDVLGKKDDILYEKGFVGEVNRQRPKNKDKNQHAVYAQVLGKLETLLNDERLSFMMKEWADQQDPMPGVLEQFLGPGDPVRIVDLSGIPNEIAGIASAVIARTLFSVKLWQTPEERRNSPILLVCEEAHRYVPDKGEAQYQAAQEAIRRIAKEGRKYGISLILVSQRPSEVDPTVLSQCNSWIVLRITNEKDANGVKAVLPDGLVNLVKMLPGLRRREAIFVGQAATIPSRVLIRELPNDKRPASGDVDFHSGWQLPGLVTDEISETVRRWRYQQREPVVNDEGNP